MSSEVDHLTAHIDNASELEDMVFNKIVNTPGIQAEINATRKETTSADFGVTDIGLLKQLSNEAGQLGDVNGFNGAGDESTDNDDNNDDNDELQTMFKEAMAQPSDPNANKQNNDDDDDESEDLSDKDVDNDKSTDQPEIIYKSDDEQDKKDKADDDDNGEKAGLLDTKKNNDKVKKTTIKISSVSQEKDNNKKDDNKKDDNNRINNESDLPNGWRVAYTSDGKKYYQNEITQQTQWKKPNVKVPYRIHSATLGAKPKTNALSGILATPTPTTASDMNETPIGIEMTTPNSPYDDDNNDFGARKQRNTIMSVSSMMTDEFGELAKTPTTRVSALLDDAGDLTIQLSKLEEQDDITFTKGELKFIKNVIKCCVAENGFDLYQLMAFDGNSDSRHGCYAWIKYLLNIIKAVLCACTQVFGIIIIMNDFVAEGLEKRDGEWCRPPNYEEYWLTVIYDSNLKILGFLFSSFLAYFSIDALMGVEQGMYKKMKYAPTIKWVNVMWLRIGFSVNVFVSIIAVYGSFVVIFFSENSLDMVLNSVALFFIVELDDLLVKQHDYERIHQHVLEYAHEKPNADLERKKCASCRKCYRCCCGNVLKCVAWLYTLPFTILRYVTIIACIFIPPCIGYCY